MLAAEYDRDRMTDNDIYDDGDYRRNVPRYRKTNHMLVRRPLGRVKPTVYELPEDRFTYGQANSYEREGAAEVVGSWATGTDASVGVPKNAARDFVRMNKRAAMNGCVTAKNVATFRRTNDIRIGQGYAQSPVASEDPGIYYPNASTVFGKPSPAPQSIGALLNNTYQRRWVQEQRDYKRAGGAEATRKPLNFAYSQHTRASLGHTKVRAAPPAPLFKMAQFQNVRSKYREDISMNTGGSQSAALRGMAKMHAPVPLSASQQLGRPEMSASQQSGRPESRRSSRQASRPMSRGQDFSATQPFDVDGQVLA